MKKRSVLFCVAGLIACASLLAFSLTENPKEDKPKEIQLEIYTNYGVMTVKLYNETPLHRDNFVKLATEGFYDSLLFHRVIQGFMIQAGDPNSKHAPAGKMLGTGGPGYTVPAEFNSNLIHKKGALAAARMGDHVNPQKASSGSQFYIVQGRPTAVGQNYSAEQREIYKTIGGTPFLDGQYTVFGEVIKGQEVIDAIASVPTQPGDRPVNDVIITKIKVLN
ncbi:MAG: peptidylprolyl isomerase [Bacteroidales bacterium]|jgi:peptidyl-prolyl cis-trans isomerase B (cyclophilin B)|nr:peptidylprolyl isomerase [Bacteroidales bacterium]